MVDFITTYPAVTAVLAVLSFFALFFGQESRSLRNKHRHMIWLVRRKEELLNREEHLRRDVMFELGSPQERSQVSKKIEMCREERLRIEGELFDQLSREL